VPQSIIWASTKAYTFLALRVRRPHISPPGARVKFGKSTATAIALPDHSAVYNVECGRPQGGDWSNADRGEGVEKRAFFADVLYGRSPMIYRTHQHNIHDMQLVTYACMQHLQNFQFLLRIM